MKPQSLLIAGGLALALVLPAFAAPNELTAAERAAGWKLLFDGGSTAAWRAFDGDKFPDRGWTVQDGALHCIPTNGRPNGGGGDLITREVFTDFEFEWEWRMSAGGNSGVKYLITPRSGGTKPMFLGDTGKALVGFEYQLIDDLTHPDAKHGPIRSSGALYQLIYPRAKTLRPVGEWNASRLVVRGTRIEHWLNGEKIVEADLGGPALQAAIAASKYAAIPRFGAKGPTPILLQDHGDGVWFRSLKIRSLAAAVASPTTSAAPATPPGALRQGDRRIRDGRPRQSPRAWRHCFHRGLRHPALDYLAGGFCRPAGHQSRIWRQLHRGAHRLRRPYPDSP